MGGRNDDALLARGSAPGVGWPYDAMLSVVHSQRTTLGT